MFENIKPEQCKSFGKKKNIHGNAVFCQKENILGNISFLAKIKWEGEEVEREKDHVSIYPWHKIKPSQIPSECPQNKIMPHVTWSHSQKQWTASFSFPPNKKQIWNFDIFHEIMVSQLPLRSTVKRYGTSLLRKILHSLFTFCEQVYSCQLQKSLIKSKISLTWSAVVKWILHFWGRRHI